MEKIQLPNKIEIKNISKNQAEIIIEPCYPGYGTTIGNALRRVLLSSLEGSAIIAVKIKGVSHEFSTMPNIKEDVVEIILNLKTIRFKLHNTETTKISLKIKGEKEVKAKDIKLTSDVEIINPEAHVATLTDKSAELEMDLFIDSGRGYCPVENMEKKKLELGTIAIDAIFTPVKNVYYDIENVRVGQMTNYDKLILGITTDGTTKPEEAFKKASSILVEHFELLVKGKVPKEKISEIDYEIKKEEKEKREEKKIISEHEKEEEKPKRKRGRPPKNKV